MTPLPSASSESEWVDVGENDESSHDDPNDESEEEEEKEENWWNEVVIKAWKQHAVALLVALVAAIYSHSKLGTNDLFSNDATDRHHDHVDAYQRTAGLEFCPNRSAYEVSGSNNLITMDFSVPLDLVSVMEQHYHADMTLDNDYSQTVNVDILKNLKEYQCMKELEKMTTQSFLKGHMQVYMTPKATDIYRDNDKSISSNNNNNFVSPSFTGFACKFINLSDKPVLLFWDGRGGHETSAKLVAEIPPFQAVGTATTPGQSFYVSPIYDGTHALQRWVVTADDALIVYQPKLPQQQQLSPQHQRLYKMQLLNLAYARDYLIKTGRPWLAAFPRPRPVHYMHPAHYVGEQISIKTNHGPNDQEQVLQLQVVSVMPRVFQIDNFLSADECRHLIQLGEKQGLAPSTVHSGGGETQRAMQDNQTRSSTNAWIAREASHVVDTIYKRAADLLNINESLLRHSSNQHDKIATHHSVAESLQLVHYGIGEEYTPHHDFVYPSVHNRFQPTRFATVLFYLSHLNLEGGETTFPRALSTTQHDGISVTPRVGRAVLFYNLLEDGNVDDTSQHGSKPVLQGDKWLANLWVWDPIID